MTKAETEFRSSQALREDLRQVLEHPTLKMALEAIKSYPDEFPQQVPGIHYDLILSREHARTIGTNNAIKRLHTLTKPISEPELNNEATRPEWSDYIPEEMKNAILKSQQTKNS